MPARPASACGMSTPTGGRTPSSAGKLAAGIVTGWRPLRRRDRSIFRTAYGLSYTDEDLVVEGPNRTASASRSIRGWRLKSSVRVLFRNLPAVEALQLRTAGGVPIGIIDVPKEKVDTNITTSLVVTF